jgi:N-acyl-D-aspartate/D-glutamate deacylase
MDFDIFIKNVKIIDGSGGKSRAGEAGVSGDTIKTVSKPGAVNDSNPEFLLIDGAGGALHWLYRYTQP